MITGQPQPMGPFNGTDEEQDPLKLAMLAAQMRSMQQPQDPQDAQLSQIATIPSSQNPTAVFQNQPQPTVDLAHASFADQPASADVAKAQEGLDAFTHRPMWKRMLAPALIGAATAAGARGWGGKQLVENGNQDIQKLGEMGQQHYQSLVNQLQYARGQQQSQYEADQRNRQQDLLMIGNNQTRSLMAKMAADSRQGVADTRADAVRDVANTGADARRDVVQTQGQTARDVAGIKGGFDIEKAKINAQAALSRFLAGEGRTDARQQAGFAHADTKPTADEDRRADLSEAMIGYADMLGDIATRRPDLFGKLAGRVTEGRQFLGSSDPDVANLKFLREQLGITQMGAHSLRSAQAIAPIADALVNSFHNDAGAVLQTIDMAKKGVGSFTGPQTRVPVVSPTTPAPTPTPTKAPLKSKVAGTPTRPPGVPSNAIWNPGRGTWQLPVSK